MVQDSYSWLPANNVSDSISNSPTTLINQNTQFIVFGENQNQCVDSDTIYVEVIEKPTVLQFPQDTVIPDGEELDVFIETSSDVKIEWESMGFISCDDCYDPMVIPNELTVYNLHVEDNAGCFSFDTSFTVDVEDYRVFIPNTFSPNNDGLNDVFMPVTHGVERLMYMYIYDSWGSLVYENKDLDSGWDGTINGDLVQANSLFVYKMRVVGFSGKTSEYVGEIKIIE